MPIETIKCQECGSAEVTEFKAGSYVCGHCEAVFKHVDPSRPVVTHSPQVCTCGRPVAGQCTICQNYVCAEHGVGGDGDSPYISYPDVCPNCRYEHMQRVRDAHPIPEVHPGRTNRATRRAWSKWYAEKDRVFDQMEKECRRNSTIFTREVHVSVCAILTKDYPWVANSADTGYWTKGHRRQPLR